MWEEILKKKGIGISPQALALALTYLQKTHAGKEYTGKEFYLLLKGVLSEIVEEDKGSTWKKPRTIKRIGHNAPSRLNSYYPAKIMVYAIKELNVPQNNYIITYEKNNTQRVIKLRIPEKHEWSSPYTVRGD